MVARRLGEVRQVPGSTAAGRPAQTARCKLRLPRGCERNPPGCQPGEPTPTLLPSRWLRCLRDAGYDGSQCLGPRNRPSSPSAVALATGPGAARPMPAALSYAWLSLGNLGSPKRTKSGTGPDAGVRDGVAPWKGLVDLSKGGVSRHQIQAKGWRRQHSTNHHHHPRTWRDGRGG